MFLNFYIISFFVGLFSFSKASDQCINALDDEGHLQLCPDNRVLVEEPCYPNSTVLALEIFYTKDRNKSFGTATLIGNNIALTAAHNLYSRDRNQESVEKYDYAKAVVGYILSIKGEEGIRVSAAVLPVRQYVLLKNYTIDPRNKAHDYALLFFDKVSAAEEKAVGAGEVYGLIPPTIYNEEIHKEALISGYPLYAHHNIPREVCFGRVHYAHQGEVFPNDPLLLHRVHTTGGQSGASLRSTHPNEHLRVFGVHVAGTPSVTPDIALVRAQDLRNVAVPLTYDSLNILKEWEDALASMHLARVADKQEALQMQERDGMIVAAIPQKAYGFIEGEK